MKRNSTFGDKVRAFGEDINYAWWMVAAWVKALVTGDKKKLLLLLTLWLGSCDKGDIFDFDCNYGEGNLQVTQPTTNLYASNQNNVVIPLTINVQDWSDCTPEGNVRITWYVVNNADGKTIPNSHFEEVSFNIAEWENIDITHSVHIPFNCNWITVQYELYSDDNSITWKESWTKNDSGSAAYSVR